MLYNCKNRCFVQYNKKNKHVILKRKRNGNIFAKCVTKTRFVGQEFARMLSYLYFCSMTYNITLLS